MLPSKLAQAGGWWGAAPPCLPTYRSIRLILCMASCKNDTEAVKQACTRLKTGGVGWGGRSPPCRLQTQCSHGWFLKNHRLSCKLAQVGGWGGAGPSISKHTARMVNGAVSKKRLRLRMAGFKKRLRGCQASLHTAQNSGGVRSPPPICKHNARMVGFIKKLTCCQASLHKRGVGGANPPPPPACKHTARMVKGKGGGGGGVQKDSYYARRVSKTA